MDAQDITIKELQKIKRRENYLKNKKRILENNSKSREKNKDKILQQKKDYYNFVKNNPEWQAKQKAKRILNKEKKKIYDEKYHELKKIEKIKKATEWNKQNKEKRAAIVFNYDSKRRVLKKSGCTSSQIKQWKEKQIKICYWCDTECSKKYHVDHYIPLSKGGEHEISNLVISCAKCNLTKNAKDPIQFANSVGRLF
jgi:5-methylcytosine-specific restriction endonuclease McrA